MKRKLWPALLVMVIASPGVRAGERVLLTGCALTSINPAVASSASDADCVWAGGQWLKIQCDTSVYYRADGTDPTTTSPKINFPGEAYPIHAQDSSGTPLKVLAVSGTAVCNVYKDDGR